jgi:uncharacterized membrane protein
MGPVARKLVYAISFETLGTVVATLGLLAMSDASVGQSFSLSVIAATVALCWSYAFNSVFEAWEARQPKRGRPWQRRALHALLFEGGLVVILVPVVAFWLDVGLRQALHYELGLIVLFIVYTYVFTWGFDAIFGLPASARGPAHDAGGPLPRTNG